MTAIAITLSVLGGLFEIGGWCWSGGDRSTSGRDGKRRRPVPTELLYVLAGSISDRVTGAVLLFGGIVLGVAGSTIGTLAS
jgi:hypothetical protein